MTKRQTVTRLLTRPLPEPPKPKDPWVTLDSHFSGVDLSKSRDFTRYVRRVVAMGRLDIGDPIMEYTPIS